MPRVRAEGAQSPELLGAAPDIRSVDPPTWPNGTAIPCTQRGCWARCRTAVNMPPCASDRPGGPLAFNVDERGASVRRVLVQRQKRRRRTGDHSTEMCSGSEAGSYLRLIDACIIQLKAQGPSRTCNERKEEEEGRWPSSVSVGLTILMRLGYFSLRS